MKHAYDIPSDWTDTPHAFDGTGARKLERPRRRAAVQEPVRVLFVGELLPGSRNLQRFEALRGLGHDVVGVQVVPEEDGALAGKPYSLLQKVLHRLGFPPDRTAANQRILEILNARDFDVLWVEKGLSIRPETLARARSKQPSMKLVFSSEDDMFARHNQSRFFRQALPHYDVVFTTKTYNLDPDELPALGAKKVVFQHKTFSPEVHCPVRVDDETRRRFGARVGFIGSFEQDRAQKMLYLAEHGVEVRVWGWEWSRWRNRHKHLVIEGRPLVGKEYAQAICSTDINLGFLRKANRDRQTGRSVEIPACGAFMLAERTEEHLLLFEEGREAAFFEGEAELLDKVRYYLEHEKERLAIARAGRERCLREDYTHEGALVRMLKVVGELG